MNVYDVKEARLQAGLQQALALCAMHEGRFEEAIKHGDVAQHCYRKIERDCADELPAMAVA